MDFLKSLANTVYERVIINWVPTLIGFLFAVITEVSDQLINWTGTLGLPPWASSALAAVFALIGAYAKSRSKPAPVP